MRTAADEKLQKSCLLDHPDLKQIRLHRMQPATIDANLTQDLQDGMIISEMRLFMTHSIDIAPPMTTIHTQVILCRNNTVQLSCMRTQHQTSKLI